MKLTKKEIKAVIAIAKRIVDKKKGTMVMQSDGDVIRIQAGNPNIIALFAIENVGRDQFSFKVKPKDLEDSMKLPKGVKKDEFEFYISDDTITEVEREKVVEIEPMDGNINHKTFETTPMNDSDRFVRILKEVEDVFCETENEATKHLQIGKRAALALEPKRIHYYQFNESFDFKKVYIHEDAVKVLSKSLKGEIEHGFFQEANALILNSDDVTYMIKSKQNLHVPNIRKIQREENAYSFIVEGKAFQDTLKAYKKKCKTLTFSFDEESDQLIIDPKNDEFPIQAIKIESFEGEFKPTMFNTDDVKGLFSSYDGKVKIQHQNFKNVHGQDGYMWWTYEPEKIIMIGGISEPDFHEEWKKVQKKK